MPFSSMGLHWNALWLSSIAVSLILLTGINRSQGAMNSKPSLPERYASLADRAIPGYKINPKPCRVKGREGTCMFVWECIKTEGQALGMCVEGFMFGSCCAHDVDNNVVPNSNPNQPDDHLPVSTTLFGLPTRPVTLPPQTTQYEKEEAENSEQEVTMAPSLITSKPLVVDMAPVTVEPVGATIASVWQKPTAASTSTTTTPASTTTTRPTPSSAPPTSSAPLSSSNTGSTVSPAQASFPEVTSPIVSPPQPNTPALVTAEPTSLSNSPISTESTTTSPFTTESSSPATTSSSLMTPVSSPSTHSVLHSTPEKPSTAQPPVSPPTVTPVPLPEESTSTSTVTTTLIPTVSMITDNAWTPITQASKNPINVVSSTLGSTVAITTSTTQSSTSTSTTTQSSRFPPTSAVTSIPSNDIHVECGVPQPIPMPELRIVGGRDAAFAAWPWQVSVRRTSFFGFSSTHRCGGALLNEQWVATAGHCVEDLLTNQIRLRLGEYDFSSSTEPYPYIEKGASKKIVHPKYNFFTYEYDLALVRLEEPINFMPHIKPICLPAIDELMVGENATVTGWGRLSEGGTLPSKLQQVTVPIVSNEKCKNMFLKAGRHEYIPEIFMCAGYEEGGRDSCQGDSGGPLQARGKDGRYFLAGIISWGIGCAEKNLPGVCTRISKFTSWILENAT